ncbi:hypothetical protein [Fructilactobacillus sanfranciscensis]|uniref:hypothetical protein n=1 Tax=Fructilactobacillus sanfranciscensis TaxID=1625 RepID=UPI001119C8EE|nr:hypothetical protein [Fructilactobacillus sanfranciscensis]NDR98144.1 hypothetical protein [Fructilactobacillus sanfranciscensis]TNK97528.1 hypothetical protein DKP75_03470 [Fructilactobacillus sanfranciscensis]
MNNQPMIPETMEQIRQRMAELEQAGQPIAEDDLIYQTIQDLLQAYLDNAEEGHYDSVKPVDAKNLDFVSITGRKLGEYQSYSDSLVNDFKTNDFKMLLDLEAAANRIAGNR